jgi:spermidine synthase
MSGLLHGVFFLSGASALAFETLWFRQAGLAFGNSLWASSLVLAGFMAGLALGSGLAGRFGQRLRSPVGAYGLLEVLIAGTGVGLVLLLPQLGSVLAPALRPIAEQPWLVNPIRLAVAFVLLLVPATAMGATLPLLCQALETRGVDFGAILGRLYGWNTLGAVFGVLVTEGLAINALGIRGSALCAGACNLAIGGTAAWIAFQRARSNRGAPSPRVQLDSTGRLWIAAVFLSGFTLLALEVFWFRFLALFVQSRSASFALMLAVVLAGIAVGGLVAARWLKTDSEAHRHASLVAFAAGALGLLSYATSPWILGPHGTGQIRTAAAISAVAIPLMFPVSVASGVFFTLAGSGLRSRLTSASNAAGTLTFFNTIGAALGSLAGGFILLPSIGVEGSFFLAGLLYAGIGIVAAAATTEVPRRAVLGAAAGFALCAAFFPFGAMEERHLLAPVARWSSPDSHVIDHREAPGETLIYVEQRELGHPHSQRLVTNALSMSSNSALSRRYMKLYVYFARAIHPELRRGLLISYGLGSTAEAFTETPGFESIDIVDISRDVLELSEAHHPHPESHPLHDPRVRVHVEDGRYFLQTTDERFDLITGEPPPPAAAGVVNLYTREYFELMRSRLAEGGLVTYWLPLHSLGDQATLSIVRSFCDAFEDCSLWNGTGADLMLLGTRNAVGHVTREHFETLWHEPALAEERLALGLEHPEQLGALFIADAPHLRELTRDTPPLTDDHPSRVLAATPMDEAPPPAFYAEWRDAAAAREHFAHSELIDLLWPASLRAASLPWFEEQHVLNGIGYGSPPLAGAANGVAALHELLTQSDLVAPVLWILGSDADLQRIADGLSETEREAPRAAYQLAVGLVSRRDFVNAAAGFARAEEDPGLRRDAFRLRVYSLCLAGEIDRARVLASERYGLRGESPANAKLPPFWQWMLTTFDVDPRAERLAESMTLPFEAKDATI